MVWKDLADQDVKPGSWDESVQLLLASGGGDDLYRGHRQFDWKLESTLERALQEHARQWDPEKHELLLSMAVDPGTEGWAKKVEIGLTAGFSASGNAIWHPGPSGRP